MNKLMTISIAALFLTACSAPKKTDSKSWYEIRNPKSTDGIYEQSTPTLTFPDITNRDSNYLVDSYPFITPEDFYNITKDSEQPYPDKIVLSINLTRDGADLFAELTARNTDKRLFFVVNDFVVNAPKIISQIQDGSTFIVLPKKQLDKLFKEI